MHNAQMVICMKSLKNLIWMFTDIEFEINVSPMRSMSLRNGSMMITCLVNPSQKLLSLCIAADINNASEIDAVAANRLALVLCVSVNDTVDL